jgi:hypothetical protein
VRDSLSILTNEELARLILRQLWQWHDASGISKGRGYRNMLLEAAMDFMPLPEMRNHDRFSIRNLLDAARMRQLPSLPPLKTKPRLKRISRRMLAIFLLREMQEWHRKDDEKNGAGSLRHEVELLDAAVNILPLASGLQKSAGWSAQDILSEARERYFIELSRRMEREDKEFFQQSD